jgi:Bacterial extracellular solute-binding proteins, family 3
MERVCFLFRHPANLVIFGLLFCFLSIIVYAEELPPLVMEYKYFNYGSTPRREEYQFALLTLALEKTIPAYGPYKVTRVNAPFSLKRINRELALGKLINVQAGAWRPIEQRERDAPAYGVRVEIPLYRGLVGYRRLIIRKEDAEKFKQIKSSDELKQLVAGQADTWVDWHVYEQNGYKVNYKGKSNNLLSMLKAKRIDYVPVDLIGPRSILEQEQALSDHLTSAEGPMLFYSWPFVFYVSSTIPKLAERVEKGLTIALKDGSFDALLYSSFEKEIAYIRKYKNHFYILKNPSLPPHLQLEPVFLK